jgi:cell division septation protein DedD
VSDINDLADDGFHEIQLSGKQLVFLFMATTVVAVVIFLCGVQVGRNVKGDRAIDTGDTSASAAPPPAAASTPSQPAAAGGPPAAEPPAPASEPDDELSYAKRLQAESPAATSEKLKTAKPAPAAVAQATPPTEGHPQVARPGAKVPAPAPLGTPRPGNWVVQVTALKDRAAAGAIAERLARNGYPAFVLDPASGSPVIFRVQVGRYGDRSEADQVKRRLEKDDQYKPYVVAAR